jgi:hypothetical protein
MRYTGLVALLFSLGALAMLASPAVDAQPKDEKPKAPFDQFVKITAKSPDGKDHVFDQIPAFRAATKAPIWRVPRQAFPDVVFTSLKMVEVTDKDGKKYPIEKTSAVMSYFQLWVAEQK